jgi:hypothetical protein
MEKELLDFIPYLLLWIGVSAVVVLHNWLSSQRVAGLLLGYVFQLWLFYWIPALMHALPDTELQRSDLTYAGFEQATYALIALVVGSFSLGLILRRFTKPVPGRVFVADPALPKAYIVSGIISYVILFPAIGRLPSVNAVVIVGQQLIVVGLCLASWKAWLEGGWPRFLRLMGNLGFVPLATMLVSGFLGYAVIAISVVIVFTVQFLRPRALVIGGGLVVGYLGLTFYVAYLQTRDEIRQSVWGEKAAFARIEALAKTFVALEPFKLTKPEHAQAVDNRLNQAILVGAAVVHMNNTGGFVQGATIWEAATAWIPRIIWPGKPGGAGSGGWASYFTGMRFEANTSVGMGQIMELYGNYGEKGVLVGFFLMGGILAALDAGAGSRLMAGNWQGFAGQFLVGIAFLNAGGSLFELISSAAASLVVIAIANSILARYQRRVRAQNRPVSRVSVPQAQGYVTFERR